MRIARQFFLSFVALALAVGLGRAQDDPPLVDQRFNYPDGIPYQADPHDGPRGTQQGYNRCNSTTEGPKSKCQTGFVNHLDDWCVWSAPGVNQTIADTEGETVAWCTKPGRGTRIIPSGAITGAQFLRAPDYVQIVGLIKQEYIGLTPDDYGGEMDPHGADKRGNPLGGLLYSNAFKSNAGNNNSYQQVIEWHNFMGGGVFCMKACDPASSQAASYCQHIYDRIGCEYNAPADYGDLSGQYLACESDNQDPPGIYTGADGTVTTYSQPPESLGPITSVPYQPKVPKTSNCMSFKSEDVFASLNAVASSTVMPSASAVLTTNAAGSTVTATLSAPIIPSNTAAASQTGAATSKRLKLNRTKGHAVIGLFANVGLVVTIILSRL